MSYNEDILNTIKDAVSQAVNDYYFDEAVKDKIKDSSLYTYISEAIDSIDTESHTIYVNNPDVLNAGLPLVKDVCAIPDVELYGYRWNLVYDGNSYATVVFDENHKEPKSSIINYGTSCTIQFNKTVELITIDINIIKSKDSK